MADDGAASANTSLLVLHRRVDADAAVLARRHRERMHCGRGCSSCCVDDIMVFDVEAERIRGRHADLLANDQPHAVGACAFLDAEGGCRIYEERPYVCRTEGLPLRWFAQDSDGSMADRRDICPLNETGQPITELDADDCWLLGPWEERLRELQARHGGALERIALRELFARTAAREELDD